MLRQTTTRSIARLKRGTRILDRIDFCGFRLMPVTEILGGFSRSKGRIRVSLVEEFLERKKRHQFLSRAIVSQELARDVGRPSLERGQTV
mmetsp:Transcript_21742/g.35036  ORF Transcript_21742/g.35036 Transcript_21742/m.35036 type:complete len:90 (-) Transcript_21742:379-648(-)